MNTFNFVMQQMLNFSMPLLVVALGGMFVERSGVVNIALEGIMIFGGFAGVMFINLFQSTISGQLLLIGGMVVAVLVGMLVSLIHGYAAINIKADQTISGTAINLLAPAFAIFAARMYFGVQQIPFTNQFLIKKVPLLGDIPFIGKIFFQNTYITFYIAIAILILSSIVLFKTKFGLRLRACGEFPQAADSVGVSVYKIRYAGVLLSGALAGLGGVIFIIPTSNSFNATVSGYGFLALAVLIFGQWNPGKIFAASIFFGLMKTLASTYSSIPFLNQLGVSSDLYKMVPYVATLIVLIFSSKRTQAPRASGVPYDKGMR